MEEETKMHDMKRQIYETERWKTDRQAVQRHRQHVYRGKYMYIGRETRYAL